MFKERVIFLCNRTSKKIGTHQPNYIKKISEEIYLIFVNSIVLKHMMVQLIMRFLLKVNQLRKLNYDSLLIMSVHVQLNLVV